MSASYTLLLHPKFQSLLLDGTPNAGGKVYTYLAGTTTLTTTFSDPGLTVPNTNPVILDASGQADIWYSGPYKLVCQDANGVQLWSADQLFGFKSDLFCSLPEQDSDKYLVWGDAEKTFKNSTMAMSYIEQCVRDFASAALSGGGLVLASPTDTTPGSLYSKISVAPGAEKSIVNQGGNERLQIAASVPAGVGAAGRINSLLMFNGF